MYGTSKRVVNKEEISEVGWAINPSVYPRKRAIAREISVCVCVLCFRRQQRTFRVEYSTNRQERWNSCGRERFKVKTVDSTISSCPRNRSRRLCGKELLRSKNATFET